MQKPINLLCAKLLLLFSLAVNTTPVMSDTPFIGEVRWFAGNFEPRGWAFCDGRLLAINSNQALFALLGTNYGGDGRTTFALPDLRGRAMVHWGSGPGLTTRILGRKGGEESVLLTENQLPAHNHQLSGDSSGGDSVVPGDRVISSVGRLRVFASSAGTDMGATSVSSSGGGQAHNNMQPNISLNCIISLVGLFPSRS